MQTTIGSVSAAWLSVELAALLADVGSQLNEEVPQRPVDEQGSSSLCQWKATSSTPGTLHRSVKSDSAVQTVIVPLVHMAAQTDDTGLSYETSEMIESCIEQLEAVEMLSWGRQERLVQATVGLVSTPRSVIAPADDTAYDRSPRGNPWECSSSTSVSATECGNVLRRLREAVRRLNDAMQGWWHTVDDCVRAQQQAMRDAKDVSARFASLERELRQRTVPSGFQLPCAMLASSSPVVAVDACCATESVSGGEAVHGVNREETAELRLMAEDHERERQHWAAERTSLGKEIVGLVDQIESCKRLQVLAMDEALATAQITWERRMNDLVASLRDEHSCALQRVVEQSNVDLAAAQVAHQHALSEKGEWQLRCMQLTKEVSLLQQLQLLTIASPIPTGRTPQALPDPGNLTTMAADERLPPLPPAHWQRKPRTTEPLGVLSPTFLSRLAAASSSVV